MLGIDKQHLAQSVLLEESGNPLVIRIVVGFVMFLIVAFVVWAGVADVEEVALAQGEVVPAGKVKPVQYAEAGRIAEILVRDGDAVKAGQPLLRLDPLDSQSETVERRVDFVSLRAQQERLQAFLQGKAAPVPHRDEGSQERIQNDLLRQLLHSRQINHSLYQDKERQQQASLAELANRERYLKEKRSTFTEELSMRQKLAEEGMSTKLNLLTLKRQLADNESEIADIGTRRTRLQREMDEATNQWRKVDSELRERALTELGRVNAELAKSEQQLARAEEKGRMTVIRAPIDGFVHGLRVVTVGAVVNRGDVMLELVPSVELHAEVRISARDIGHVKVGQPVKVRLTAYDFSRYGAVHGSLLEISPTAFLDKDGSPYHRGFVALEHDYVGAIAGQYPIISGMTLQADIRTGSKTVLAYLLKPIYASAKQAMHER